jgi:hypothetical protein
VVSWKIWGGKRLREGATGAKRSIIVDRHEGSRARYQNQVSFRQIIRYVPEVLVVPADYTCGYRSAAEQEKKKVCY